MKESFMFVCLELYGNWLLDWISDAIGKLYTSLVIAVLIVFILCNECKDKITIDLIVSSINNKSRVKVHHLVRLSIFKYRL